MNIQKIQKLAQQWVEAHSHRWSNNTSEVGDNYGSFIEGYKVSEKELQKEIQSLKETIKGYQEAVDSLPTYDDVIRTIDLSREYNDGWLYTEEEIIEKIDVKKMVSSQTERMYSEEEVDKLISNFQHDLRESSSTIVKQNCEGAIFGLNKLKESKQ